MPSLRAPRLSAALSHTAFRRLWLGQAVSALGDQMYTVAIAVFVLGAGHGATGLGVVLAARTVAMVALLLIGGVVGDRMPRTRVMIAADLLRGAAVAAIAVLPGGTSLAVIAAASFLVGAGEAFFRPAYGALVPSVLPEHLLQPGNALTALAQQLSFVAGPALAGLIVGVAGARAALAIDAATFVVSMLTLMAVREPARRTAAGRPRVRAEIRDGLDAVRARGWLAAVLLLAMVHLLFAVGPWTVLLPVVARADLGGTSAYSTILVLFGIGSVLGAVFAGRLHVRAPGVVALLALTPFGLMLLALAGPASLTVVAVAAGLAGLGVAVFEVLWISALQREVPRHLLARVISLDWMVSVALLPAGLALAGPAADAIGARDVLLIGGIVMLATALPLLAVPSVRRLQGAASADHS